MPVQTPATPDRSLVMSRKAVRVRSSALRFTCKSSKNEKPRCPCRGLCQQYVSSRLYPKASSSALACYKGLWGTAGGVGESSGIDPLSDVPRFRRVRYRRKSLVQVPRSRILRTSPLRRSPKFESTFRRVCRWTILELTSTKVAYGLLVQRCDPPKSQGGTSRWSGSLL